MVKFRCPYTNDIISEKNQIGSYIRSTSKNKNIDKDYLKYLIYKQTYGDIVSKVKFENYYVGLGYSLPMFLKDFGITYNITQFLIKYHKLPKRSMSESTKLGAVRAKLTNLDRYGVDQIFKLKIFDDKRKKTYLERYGVENPFTKATCLKNLNDLYIKRYGIGLKEYKSLKSKSVWKKKTPEQKENWLKNSILSDKSKKECLHTLGCNQSSKPEILIGKLLLDEGFNITSQFRVGRYAFDYALTDFNILIEFNGDLFHANPEKYLEDDYIPLVKKTAKDIWDKDFIKTQQAISRGYSIIVIWENEIKNKDDSYIKDLIYFKISDSLKTSIEYENKEY